MCRTHVAFVSAQGQWTQLKVRYQTIKYQTLYRVCSVHVSPTPIEIMSLILAQMFTSTRGCAEPMLPFCRLKAKVTIEGKNDLENVF